MADKKTDVAHTLADALQKIENILSDDRNQGHFLTEDTFYQNGSDDPADLPLKIRNYAIELRSCVERLDPSLKLENKINIPVDTVNVLVKWLKQIDPESSQQSNGEKTEPILNHNHDASGELLKCRKKISRLENEKDSLLLQVSVLTDQVEVQGEKMRELEFLRDELHIRLAELEDSIKKAKNENNSLQSTLADLKLLNKNEKDDETWISKEKEMKEKILKKDLEIEDLRTHLETLLDEEEREKRLSSSSDSGSSFGMKVQLREKASEVSRLKIKVEKLTDILTQKEKQIEDLEQQLHVATSKSSNEDAKSETSGNSSLTSDVVTEQTKKDGVKDVSKDRGSSHTVQNGHDEMPGETTCILLNNNSARRAMEMKSSPANKTELPVNHHQTPLKRDNKTRSSFGKGFLKLKRTRSLSEPNLSPTEKGSTDESQHKTSEDHDDLHEKGKKRNIVGKVFGKLRRSNSQGLESEMKNHKNAGNLRKFHSDVPFSSWSTDMVVSWLQDEGLGQYTDVCSNHIKSGDDLIKMTSADLEKVFGMKKILHRKKLHLALQAVTEEQEDVMEQLDNNWVLDWLEDIGLPQYKDSFHDNLIDGRVLNYLTVNDVLQLKVHSTFHQHSLRRAIQCLRVHNFHPNYLKKSPIDESWQQGAHVVLWTNHRVTEWLRQADLSEYATNLRGSGVHGSLMILEPRFTAESMATILAIPTGKKLLRRHLATHFESLIGAACMKVKETALANGLAPLLPGDKHKTRKISIGGMRKRTKSDAECEEYVCPMDTEVPVALQKIFAHRLRKVEGVPQGRGKVPNIDGEEQRSNDELTQTLGTFSKELNSLTNMLGSDDSNER